MSLEDGRFSFVTLREVVCHLGSTWMDSNTGILQYLVLGAMHNIIKWIWFGVGYIDIIKLDTKSMPNFGFGLLQLLSLSIFRKSAGRCAEEREQHLG